MIENPPSSQGLDPNTKGGALGASSMARLNYITISISLSTN